MEIQARNPFFQVPNKFIIPVANGVPGAGSYSAGRAHPGLQSVPRKAILNTRGGWLHFLSSLWTLFIFGSNVEDRTGSHDYPINIEQARELNLKISADMPEEIYKLMNLFPQTQQRRPSVECIPLPYPARPAMPERKNHTN